jgi:periplasmic protein TonB
MVLKEPPLQPLVETPMTATWSQPKSNRKLIGAVVVVLLHLFAFFLLQSGIGKQSIEKVKNVVQATIIDEIKPKVEPPKPPPEPPKVIPPEPPKLKPPEIKPPVVKPPEIKPEKVETLPVPIPVPAVQPTQPSPIVAAPAPTAPPPPPVVQPTTPTPPIPTPVAAPPRPAVRTGATSISSSCEQPEYPAISRRAGEEGIVTLEFIIGVDGRVVQSKVASSSGYPRLDEAARSGLSKCKFSPATVDGVAVQSTTKMPYRWLLE